MSLIVYVEFELQTLRRKWHKSDWRLAYYSNPGLKSSKPRAFIIRAWHTHDMMPKLSDSWLNCVITSSVT